MSVQTQIDRINQNVANTYAVLSALGADLPDEQSSDNLASTAGKVKAVLHSKQTLTATQQAQARTNIGAASQEEVNQLSENIAEMDILQEVEKTVITNNLNDGAFEWGALNSSGGEFDLSPANYGFRSVNYLSVEGGRKLAWNANRATIGNYNAIEIHQYNSNKTFISKSSLPIEANKYDTGSSKTVTLDENTFSVRIYLYKGSTAVDLAAIQLNLFYVENVEEFWSGAGDVFKYVPHTVSESAGTFVPMQKIQSPLTGKKIVYDGDSICYGVYGGGGYAKLIADTVHGTYKNFAKGGARLTTKPSGQTYHSVVDNIVNLPTDGDLYCFEGGINDYWTSGMQLGTFTKNDFTGTLDTSTICGALEQIFRYALNTFVGKPICFVITHKIQNTAYRPLDNNHTSTFEDYRNAMVGICQKYSIPYYDAFSESGLNGWNTAQNNAYLTGNTNGTADGCHPNEEGYKRYYVPQLIHLFERIMPV